MANSWWNRAVLNMCTNTLDVLAHNIKAVGLTSGYTFSQADNYRDDISGFEIAGTVTGNLAGKTITGRVLDGTDLSLPNPASGTMAYIAVFRDSGLATTSELIYFIDTDTTGKLPLTMDSNADTIQWNPSGIIRLGSASFDTNYDVCADWLNRIFRNEITIADTGENLASNLSRFYVVGIDATALAAFNPGTATDLSAFAEANEVTPHTQIDSGAAGSIQWDVGNSRVRHDSPDTTLPNDASGTMVALVVYYLPTDTTFNPASPATNRTSTRMVACIDVADTVMDGNDDTIQWDTAGVWGVDF